MDGFALRYKRQPFLPMSLSTSASSSSLSARVCEAALVEKLRHLAHCPPLAVDIERTEVHLKPYWTVQGVFEGELKRNSCWLCDDIPLPILSHKGIHNHFYLSAARA